VAGDQMSFVKNIAQNVAQYIVLILMHNLNRVIFIKLPKVNNHQIFAQSGHPEDDNLEVDILTGGHLAVYVLTYRRKNASWKSPVFRFFTAIKGMILLRRLLKCGKRALGASPLLPEENTFGSNPARVKSFLVKT
jgi:hypothetical protein